jgi:large repetitive protein
VALSGDTAIVGAPFDDTTGGAEAGSAYVFVRSGTTWSEQQHLTAADPGGEDQLGFSVAVSGDTVVVGANRDDTTDGPDAGTANVFTRSGTTWSEQRTLRSIRLGAGQFGSSVAVDGDTVVAGAPLEGFVGAAYAFQVVPPAPVILSFSPVAGSVGKAVTITGSGFTDATQVTFNGTAATFTVVSSGVITTRVSNGALTGPITVATPFGGTSSATDFKVKPKIGSFTPTGGPVGTSVTIRGTAFTGATKVTFNGVEATFTVVSYTRISATVPAGASTGRIKVTTPGGTGTSATDFVVT